MSLLLEELKTLGLIGAKRVIPEPMINQLRDAKRKWARRGLREAESKIIPLNQAELEADLRNLGVRVGRDLLIHSSMSKLGPVQGGAVAVIRGFQAVAGPEATLIMPAYPTPATMSQWMHDPAPFHMAESPSRMGILTEVFRRMPGALRSAHPSHSVTALGPNARDYTAAHHQAETPCGPGSPFLIHAERGGDILCIGTGVGKITSYHLIEDQLEAFPLRVYPGERMGKLVIFPDGRRERIEVRVGDSRLSPWRVDNFKPKETEFLSHLRSFGACKEGRIGEAACHLIDAARFQAMMAELAHRGITIYHRPRWARLSNLPALRARR
jgi:aminoglycoside 3-N-acetyltransferase